MSQGNDLFGRVVIRPLVSAALGAKRRRRPADRWREKSTSCSLAVPSWRCRLDVEVGLAGVSVV